MSDVVVPGTREPAGGGWATLTHAMYAMHVMSWISLGFLSLIAIVINYVKRSEVPNDFLLSHFRWQSRSFWFTLIALVVTAPLWVLFVFPGYVAWMLIGLWYLYRFVKGWWWFAECRAMPMPA